MAQREFRQPRQIERQQIAALGIVDGVQFVEHHGLQMLEHPRRIAMRQQQRQLFGGGEQNIRRGISLALAAAGRRVAGARFGAHVEPHLRHRRFQIARHVHRQSLQRRDIERMQSARAPPWPHRQFNQRRQKPARVLPPPVGATSNTDSPRAACSISAS